MVRRLHSIDGGGVGGIHISREYPILGLKDGGL